MPVRDKAKKAAYDKAWKLSNPAANRRHTRKAKRRLVQLAEGVFIESRAISATKNYLTKKFNAVPDLAIVEALSINILIKRKLKEVTHNEKHR